MAVIVLQESMVCTTNIYITEGDNATVCADVVYTYGDLPTTTNISVLLTTSNGTALSTSRVCDAWQECYKLHAVMLYK